MAVDSHLFSILNSFSGDLWVFLIFSDRYNFVIFIILFLSVCSGNFNTLIYTKLNAKEFRERTLSLASCCFCRTKDSCSDRNCGVSSSLWERIVRYGLKTAFFSSFPTFANNRPIYFSSSRSFSSRLRL